MSKTTDKKHNYIYRVENLLDGKFYYGIHSTDNLNDRYFAGGVLIRRAIKKHGIENFAREIIADYPTRKEVSEHEKSIVTMELIEDEMCYNLITGGDNMAEVGYSAQRNEKVRLGKLGKKYFEGKQHTDKTKQLMREIMSEKYGDGKHPLIGVKKSPEAIINMTIAQQKNAKYGIENPQFGRKRSPETCKLISESNMGKPKHDENSRLKMSNSRRGKPHGGRRCSIENTPYRSVAEASRDLNVSSKYIRTRLDSSKPDWATWIYIDPARINK